MIKKEIFDLIDEKYPEFGNLKVKFNNEIIDYEHHERLFQYLIYENTLDSHRRMILLYHLKGSKIYKYIPFFIILGIYKKEIKRIGNPYEELYSSVEVLKNGSFLKFDRINYEKKILDFMGGISSEEVKFEDFILCEPSSAKHIKEYKRIKEIIGKCLLKECNTVEGIFNVSIYKDYNPESGVIIFTSKTKFEILIKNLSFNDRNITDYIHIQKAIWKKQKGIYDYVTISRCRDSKVSVLLAEYQDIHAIDIFKNKYNNLDTIIFDDFELNYKSKKEEMLGFINECKEKINNKILRDIYMIFSDSELNYFYNFNNENLNCLSWIISDIDFRKTEEYGNLKLILINDKKYNYIIEKYYDALSTIISLIKQGIFSKDIFTVLALFSKLRKRYTSFYDSENIYHMIEEAKRNFKNYMDEKLYSEIYLLEKKEITNYLNELSDSLINNKINKFFELGIKLEGNVAFISENDILEDELFLINEFKKKNINIEKYEDNKKYDNLLILGITKDIRYMINYNKLADNVFLILSKNEYEYLLKNAKYVQKIIDTISNNNYRKNLLNLETEEYFNETKFVGLTNNLDFLTENQDFSNIDEKEQDHCNMELEKDFIDLDDQINDLISQSYQKYYGDITKHPEVSRDMIVFILDDGTIIEKFNKSRLYIWTGEEIRDIENLEKYACEVNIGDEIFLFKGDYGNNEFNKLLNEKIMNTEDYDEIFMCAESWRNQLISLSARFTDTEIRNKLSNHGFTRTVATISNWINGRTTVPDEFEKLIKTINVLSRVNTHNIQCIDNPEKVIECSKRIGRIKTKIPKMIKDKSIEKLCGISVEIEDVTLRKLFNEIYDCIDLKKITHIIKDNNADNTV